MNTNEYRVYDTVEKRWVEHEVVINSCGSIYGIKNFLTGTKPKKTKLELLQTEHILKTNITPRYVVYHGIGFEDKARVHIFEGDILHDSKGIVGVVSFVDDLGAYVLLSYKDHKYYPLSSERCKTLRAVGHITDKDSDETLGMFSKRGG